MSHLVVVSPPRASHRDGCTFGSGFYRILLSDGTRRYCQSDVEVQRVLSLLPGESVRRVQRDACLDEAETGDANTPDVVDAAAWLGLPKGDGMRELGLSHEADYVRAYRMVEDAVLARDRAAQLGGVRASVVIKRRGAKVSDI